MEEVRGDFKAFGMLDHKVHFLKGWLKNTLSTAVINELAILRLDGCYYEYSWERLSALCDRPSVGGYVIVDDYGEDLWTYCAQAVDDFRTKHELPATM